jgi:hypothetical protein
MAYMHTLARYTSHKRSPITPEPSSLEVAVSRHRTQTPGHTYNYLILVTVGCTAVQKLPHLISHTLSLHKHCHCLPRSAIKITALHLLDILVARRLKTLGTRNTGSPQAETLHSQHWWPRGQITALTTLVAHRLKHGTRNTGGPRA